MAITRGTEPVLDAAARWKETCLLSGGSIFVPERRLWTPDHLDELKEHFIDNPRLGSEGFSEKFETQLHPATQGAKQLAAEFLWLLLLFPAEFGHDTKLQKIRSVWEWSGEPLPDAPVLGAPLARGIGSVGPGLINHQAFELMYLITVVRELMAMTRQDRQALLEDPWDWANWLYRDRDLGQRQSPFILAHLLHPETFEGIASDQMKRTILKAFGHKEVAGSGSRLEVDRALFELRGTLKAEYPDRPYLSYFRPPLIERWQTAEVPDFEFIEEKLEIARRAFLNAHPEFKSFSKPGPKFHDEERGYKDDLVREFEAIQRELPSAAEVTQKAADQLMESLKHLITGTLQPSGRRQNLINWRYTRFLTELEPGERMIFARALAALVSEEGDAAGKAKAFVDDIWPLVEAHDAGGYATSRSLTSFFLFLHDPKREIYIRTDSFNSLCDRLTGERLFLNKRLDLQEYSKAVAFAENVEEQLERWDWAPRDMIDVQSFIYLASAGWEDASSEGGIVNGGTVGEPGPPYGDAHRDLDEVVQVLQEEGFHFAPELVANYILALQTKRLAILTGISGTGKSKLAIRIGEFFAAGEGGDPSEAEDRVLVVAVRPDWTDPGGLIGYYNPITEQYVGTRFLRLLRKARAEEERAGRDGRPAAPFFVILDEMNLARVEHYFSDFLSSLESSRPLTLHHRDGTANEAEGEEGEGIPSQLRIPRNVFFTGTVNVDETTHMFSPKVLDRAFTLELNDVDLDGWAMADTDADGTGHTLHLSRLAQHLVWKGEPGAEHWTEFGELLDGRLREVVTGLNRALAPWRYHFGYRVAGEIARFVLLAHAQGADSEEALWTALDLAILQKVLPKFHGTEQELEHPLRVVGFTARNGRAPTENEIRSEAAVNPEAEGSDAKLPRCEAKVERMLRRLRHRGFASFIE